MQNLAESQHSSELRPLCQFIVTEGMYNQTFLQGETKKTKMQIIYFIPDQAELLSACFIIGT